MHKKLDSFGHVSKTAQEKRGIFHSVVADGIYLHYKHVFGHNLGRKRVWITGLMLGLLSQVGIEKLNVFKGKLLSKIIARKKKVIGPRFIQNRCVFEDYRIFIKYNKELTI